MRRGGVRHAIRLIVLLVCAAAALAGTAGCGALGSGSTASRSPSVAAAPARSGTTVATPATRTPVVAVASPTATPSPTAIATPLPPGDHVTITTTDLNVRTAPSLDAYVVGRLEPGDAVSVVGKSKDGEWLALAGLGWSFYTQGWYSPDPNLNTLTALPPNGVPSPTYPPSTTSGFPVIDDVVTGVAQRDAAGLASAAGARVQLQACGSGQWAPDQPQDAIAKFLATGTSLRLYAVYAAPKDATDATFVVVFGSDSGAGASLWLGKAGGIARVAAGCGKGPGDYLPPAGGTQPVYYLRPNAPSPLRPAH